MLQLVSASGRISAPVKQPFRPGWFRASNFSAFCIGFGQRRSTCMFRKALVVMAAAVRAEGSGSMDPGAFLQALPGSWEGFAVQTPLGRMPYNLDFRVLDDRSVKGVSPTNGVAVHTWSFKESQDKEGLPQLSLNFHSTFGNSFATGLVATSVDADKGMKFSGGQPEKLEVWVRLGSTLSQETWQAEILLDGNPHVSISALRPKKACSGS